jgi:hypothetical protein
MEGRTEGHLRVIRKVISVMEATGISAWRPTCYSAQ